MEEHTEAVQGLAAFPRRGTKERGVFVDEITHGYPVRNKGFIHRRGIGFLQPEGSGIDQDVGSLKAGQTFP